MFASDDLTTSSIWSPVVRRLLGYAGFSPKWLRLSELTS